MPSRREHARPGDSSLNLCFAIYGAVSMARGQPDSASSGWFIYINDQPSLDFGGARNPDGQGFAAFGRVVRGMDVVRKIQQAPNADAQRLTPPIKILKAGRMQ
jgi:peptidyl-prolyl cis-trans isomerase A (cyclophilin A)